MKYVSIPVEIEAIQFLNNNFNELISFTGVENIQMEFKDGRWSCTINTPLARLVVMEKDYIIKSETNMLSVLKPDIFEKSYTAKE